MGAAAEGQRPTVISRPAPGTVACSGSHSDSQRRKQPHKASTRTAHYYTPARALTLTRSGRMKQTNEISKNKKKKERNRLGSEISSPVMKMTERINMSAHAECLSAIYIMCVDLFVVVSSSLSNGQKRSFFFFFSLSACLCSAGRVSAGVVSCSVLFSAPAVALALRAWRQVESSTVVEGRLAAQRHSRTGAERADEKTGPMGDRATPANRHSHCISAQTYEWRRRDRAADGGGEHGWRSTQTVEQPQPSLPSVCARPPAHESQATGHKPSGDAISRPEIEAVGGGDRCGSRQQ